MKDKIQEIASLLEAYIHELDDETVENARTQRVKNYSDAVDRFGRAKPGTEERQKRAKEAEAAGKKLDKMRKLYAQRTKRKADAKQKFEEFREKLLNSPVNIKTVKKAGEDSLNAQLNQGLRNKLEKIYNGVPASIKEEFISIVEAILAENLPTYTDENGHTQYQMFANNLTGRNLQQEEQEAQEQKKQQAEIKKNTPKNPNRIEGGKKAHETRQARRRQEFAQRPIFQALGYKPDQGK